MPMEVRDRCVFAGGKSGNWRRTSEEERDEGRDEKEEGVLKAEYSSKKECMLTIPEPC